jgi:hypothetical protein
MNLTLRRKLYRADGIFSACYDESGIKRWETLEHAYGSADQGWLPKIPPGLWTCVRSMHRLHGMAHDFETFEITGVEGHSDLLFHWGNFNRDSEGCILLGEDLFESKDGEEMITASRAAFADFMKLQEGVDSFTLEVTA